MQCINIMHNWLRDGSVQPQIRQAHCSKVAKQNFTCCIFIKFKHDFIANVHVYERMQEMHVPPTYSNLQVRRNIKFYF